MLDDIVYNLLLFVIVFFILCYILSLSIDYCEEQNEQKRIYKLNNERQKFQV